MEQMCDILIERVQTLEKEEGALRCGQAWLSRQLALAADGTALALRALDDAHSFTSFAKQG